MCASDSCKRPDFRSILFVLTRFSQHFHTFCFAGLTVAQRSGSASDDLLQFVEMDTFSSRVSTVSLLASA